MKLQLCKCCPRLAAPCFLSVLLVLIVGGCKPQPPTHGTLFVLQPGTNPPGATASFSELLDPLRARFVTLGVQPFFEQHAGGGLVIKVARLKTDRLETVRQMIATQGQLEFRMVHTNSNELVEKGLVEPGYELLTQPFQGPRGEGLKRSWIVDRKPERGLTGKHFKRVMVTRQGVTSAPEIVFELDAEGARLFEEITRQYLPSAGRFHHLAIVLDGQIFSAPRIMGVISGGRGIISGDLTFPQALALRSVLENPLSVPCRVVEERTF